MKLIKTSQLRPKTFPRGSAEPMLTDQSQTPQTEILNIVEQFVKTGHVPHTSPYELQYVDDITMNSTSFEEKHNIKVKAMDLFNRLPQQIRNEIQNDPNKLEAWILNPENTDRAIKHGLLKKRQKTQNEDFSEEKPHSLSADQKLPLESDKK